MPIFRLPVVIVLTIVAYVAGAPSRKPDGHPLGYIDAVGQLENQKDNSLDRDDFIRKIYVLSTAPRSPFGWHENPVEIRDRKMRFASLKHAEKVPVRKAAMSKRNFDEIDRTTFDSFVKKNYMLPLYADWHLRGNFDEIDQGIPYFGEYP